MDELDFDFGGPPAKSLSQDSSKAAGRSSSSKGSSRTSSSRRRNKFGGINESFSSSTTVTSTDMYSKLTSDSSNSRRKQQQRKNSAQQRDPEDELASTASSSSSKGSSAASTVLSTNARLVIRSKNRASVVLGGGSGVYAAQDVGNYQMLHDECAFLCSTILSRRRHPSKAVDATIELVTILSSRKTRAVLWQGCPNQDDDDGPDFGGRNRPSSMYPPLPKLWRSILEIIAVMTQQNTERSPITKNESSSITAHSNNPGAARNNFNCIKGTSPLKGRTKGARRKQQEMMQGAGGDGEGESSAVNGSVGSATQMTILTPEMKEALACLIYFLSCDCTMTENKSVAVMGNIKTPTLARKIRLGILRYGSAIAGIMRLMMPTTNKPAAASFATLNKMPSNALFSQDDDVTRSPKSVSRLDPSSTNNDAASLTARDVKAGTNSPAKSENPAKLGRMIRMKRKRMARDAAERQESNADVAKSLLGIVGQADLASESVGEDSKMMPPPSKRCAMGMKNVAGFGRDDDLSFKSSSVASPGEMSFPGERLAARNIKGSRYSWDEDFSLGSDTKGATSTLSASAAQKLASLRSKVHLETSSHEKSQKLDSEVVVGDVGTNLQEAFYCDRTTSSVDPEILPAGDYPWVTMVCLESLNRIITGKEGKEDGGKSCLVGDDTIGRRGLENPEEDSSSEEDENRNPIVVTNHLLGKSGVISLLGKAMSQSMEFARKLTFAKDQRNNGVFGNVDDSVSSEDNECWNYCHDRLSLLSSLIDDACLFSKSNRRGFCEEDPFDFDSRKDGLIFQILLFLHQCSQSNLHEIDEKRSATMFLALRTLISLTHDNALATQQMTLSLSMGIENLRGIEVLAELIFQLVEPRTLSPSKGRRSNTDTLKQATDHDAHRYDSTSYCFNTLANVIEGAGVRNALAEVTVQPGSLGAISWLKWLCQWFVKQSETFHADLIAAEREKQFQGSAKRVTPAPTMRSRNGINDLGDQVKHVETHEVEKLVAAGYCCVFLACMMIEPKNDDDPEFSVSKIRQLILKEMPASDDGSTDGVTIIINTLKAFCNFINELGLGGISLAMVNPVQQLIRDLEEMENIDDPIGGVKLTKRTIRNE